jgi:hypothetical protein
MRNKNEFKNYWVKRTEKWNPLINKFISIYIFLLVPLLPVIAQETIPASGGNASGNGGSVSYTVGQVVYTTNAGTSGSEAQGVQQPYEISVVTGNEQFKNINLTCSVFPNPTSDLITLKIDGGIPLKLIASLYDINGKQLLIKNVNSNETTIPIGTQIPGAYFLKLTNNNQEIKSFKIIKK